METVALLLANPGQTKEADLDNIFGLDGPQEELDLNGVVSDFSLWKDYLVNKGIGVSARSVCDSRLKRLDALDRIRSFFSFFAGCFLLVYMGHGKEDCGNWEMADGDISFWDVVSAWLQYGHVEHFQTRCIIVSDCCYSGKWPLLALSLQIPSLDVQSAVNVDALARDCQPTFSQVFLRMQDTKGEATFPEPLKRRWRPMSTTTGARAHEPLAFVGGAEACARLYLERFWNRSGILTSGWLADTTFSMQQREGSSTWHRATATVCGREVGSVVVKEDPGVALQMTHVYVEPDLRRHGIASRLLRGMFSRLTQVAQSSHIDIVFLQSNAEVLESVYAHGFSDLRVPSLNNNSDEVRFGRRVAEEEVQFSWSDRDTDPELFASASELFVTTFLQQYQDSSEASLGIKEKKAAWLKQTIQEERNLQSSHPDQYEWLIGRVGSNVVALTILELLAYDPTSSRTCHVRQIALAKQFQGRGLGKVIAKKIESKFADIARFTCVTRKINLQSQAFLAKLGFKEREDSTSGYDTTHYVALSMEVPTHCSPATGYHRSPSPKPSFKPRTNAEFSSLIDNVSCVLHLDDFEFCVDDELLQHEALRLLQRCFLDHYVSFSEEDLGTSKPKQVWLSEVAEKELRLQQECPGRYRWLTACKAGTVLGLLILDIGVQPQCFVTDVVARQFVVSSEYQRQGLGMEMCIRVLELFADIRRIKACTRSKNLTSQRFLKKIGFREMAMKSQEYDSPHYVMFSRDLTAASVREGR
ncbi:unnamed protein product [Symbiodinium sp. CCMP2592]|nr:unnamed protein product [Symbiodinium sp. CCMP2592]